MKKIIATISLHKCMGLRYGTQVDFASNATEFTTNWNNSIMIQHDSSLQSSRQSSNIFCFYNSNNTYL